jgi:hypothetical protein
MELREQPPRPTLASRLGEVPHFSGLAVRLARQSGAGERLADWLLKVAVQRGASHYQREVDPTLPPDDPSVSDEEIGIALCLGQHTYDLTYLRVAAQFLSSPRIDPAKLARLAVQERCEPVFHHLAALAARFAPELEPWAYLREHLPARPPFARMRFHIGPEWSATRE